MNGFHSLGRGISAHEAASTIGRKIANWIDGKTMGVRWAQKARGLTALEWRSARGRDYVNGPRAEREPPSSSDDARRPQRGGHLGGSDLGALHGQMDAVGLTYPHPAPAVCHHVAIDPAGGEDLVEA